MISVFDVHDVSLQVQAFLTDLMLFRASILYHTISTKVIISTFICIFIVLKQTLFIVTTPKEAIFNQTLHTNF